jgi:hypothetical protein
MNRLLVAILRRSVIACRSYLEALSGKMGALHNLVFCLYSNEQASFPVAFHLVQKTEGVTDKNTGKEKWQHSVTKNEIARQMVASIVAKQIPFRYILADVWLSCAENMTYFKRKAKKDFILPLNRNKQKQEQVAHRKADLETLKKGRAWAD